MVTKKKPVKKVKKSVKKPVKKVTKKTAKKSSAVKAKKNIVVAPIVDGGVVLVSPVSQDLN